MTTGRKILNLVIALLMILGGLILILVPEKGLLIVAVILSISLLVYGVRLLIYYFGMARNMVGGRMMLYMAIVVIDAGLFSFVLFNASSVFIMLYLIAVYLISAVFEILEALEAKKMGAPSWKRRLVLAAGNILIAVLCCIFIRSAGIPAIIYGAGLFYSAIKRIIDTFRKTAVLYIAN